MLLQGKKALILGLANNKSIAYGIAKAFRDNGAEIALTWPGEAIRKRMAPLAEELGAAFIMPCDVTDDGQIAAAASQLKETWGTFDILVVAVAYANREDLLGRYIDTSRAGFALAMDISAYSLVAVCSAFAPLMTENGSVMTLTYYGAEKVITNYNVMGVAKAALEASVRYLAYDLGERNIRINAISAGPIKTLAASGIGGFNRILNHIDKHSPLHRNVTIDDVGSTALFLASPLSSGITGQTIYVDSGYCISGTQLGDAE
ncbi:Enoyl-(acyl-carrier-protein) reductase (NADH) 1 [uncultured delta proteobacterium]|uniref:Enoyl-[acyl-carrier-protein] reductase [NADH] n=1 Tax=uncultured delta proteobacterium TaxID=34034 RepID=A0A212JVI1_9DELT|nr:Enoyl-(acyl-carrier-protein) reductase (NADH) 1 [uncultured delta proteobacterium]